MTRLEKLIGFPIPQEHRKELNDKLNTYLNCDKTTLISALLQYDWELLQNREPTTKVVRITQEELIAEREGNGLSSEFLKSKLF